ncbi:uncharacterized protein LOC141721013 [Apium graveolens]|uniref:uncharacterized protein LOC141721013 n=1 Tax=Apium graveolens TaxID=4045 RepID=UPI003D7ADCA8
MLLLTVCMELQDLDVSVVSILILNGCRTADQILKLIPNIESFLATVSTKGTLVRVYNTLDGLLLQEVVLGPATVGGIQAGALKIGDTAGIIDNIIQCKLYSLGCVLFLFNCI